MTFCGSRNWLYHFAVSATQSADFPLLKTMGRGKKGRSFPQWVGKIPARGGKGKCKEGNGEKDGGNNPSTSAGQGTDPDESSDCSSIVSDVPYSRVCNDIADLQAEVQNLREAVFGTWFSAHGLRHIGHARLLVLHSRAIACILEANPSLASALFGRHAQMREALSARPDTHPSSALN